MAVETEDDFVTNDNVRIHYRQVDNRNSEICIILIHGFSGSSKYFIRNMEALAKKHKVIAYDLRGHGQSDTPRHGYHVSRLAADLYDLIGHLRTKLGTATSFIGVGCSIGAAILWSYIELYGDHDFDKYVFVDQAPLQNYTVDGTWGPSRGNYGCHDASSTAWAQGNLIFNFTETNRGLVKACLGYRFAPEPEDHISTKQQEEDENFFMGISAQCSPEFLAKLLGDHTQYDHRDTIRNCISKPVLVLAGRRSGSFPTEGCFETVKLINESHDGLATGIEYDSGHWLYYEEAERFAHDILEFI